MPADPLFDRLARALTGRYTLVRELGQGGMATVYLGSDVKLGRRVAIKVLPPRTRAYLGIDRFQREVLLAARLSHPHIVPLFEADEADELLFYVMEYAEGESLKDRIAREGPLPMDEAIRIAAEVGDALQYAHESGVIHRDIKPGNILLARGHAMVTDFGIAKVIAESGAASDRSSCTGTGITLGTAEYMSPEQAGGEKHIDARSDVYALAAVLYEMLAGEPPFTGPSVQAIVARVLSEAPRPLRTLRPALPAHIERAIAAGLAKQAADRPATARIFVDRLTRPAAERWVRPARWLKVTAAVLLLGAAGMATWLAARRLPAAGRQPAGMVLVPGDAYRLSRGPGRPTAVVVLDSFYIDATEVTVGAYAPFLRGTHAVAPWRHQPAATWPVTGVLWAEAQAFCRWRDPATRLPTEAEWEAAAEGPNGESYPWGNAWEAGRSNAAGATDTLQPVGSFPLGRSHVGALDLIGNAWEWVAAETLDSSGQVLHAIKGGAFDTPPSNAAIFQRSWFPEDRHAVWKTGFRCARRK